MPCIGDIDDIERAYRATIVEWAQVPNSRFEAANLLFDRYQALGEELARSAEGRKAIGRLMDDEVLEVRLAAAARALRWDERRARAVLEAIRDGDHPHAMTADFTLRKHDGLPLV
jgi:hypothetical protein